MTENSKTFVGVNLPEDLFNWLEETRKYENRKRGNQIIQLLYEAKVNRILNANATPADITPGAVNMLTLEQAKARGIVK